MKMVNNQNLLLSEEDMSTFQKAWDKWGQRAQLGMIIEECAELIKAVCKFIRNDELIENPKKEKDINHIVEEMVDIVIMCEQFLYIFKKGKEFYHIRREKMDRLDGRLNV